MTRYCTCTLAALVIAATVPVRRDESYVIYEYACHEGIYAIRHVLRAARAAERTIK